MTNEDDNDFFLNSLNGVKPIKKTNKVVKKVPKHKGFKKTEKKKQNPDKSQYAQQISYENLGHPG